MDLNIFNNLDNNLNKDEEISKIIDEMKELIEQETIKTEEKTILEENENRKEGHLYLVTEDRNGEVYLWDYTEKSEIEFEEKNLPSEVLVFATEGAMLEFKNGEYILYSPDGYDIIDAEEDSEI